MLISIIAAVAENGVIGRDNQLPWHIPEDLRYFKEMTLGKPVIMGRKTFDSIARPLPGRLNIVVTRQTAWSVEGVKVVHTLDDALQAAEHYCAQHNVDEAIVAGGSGIYELALPAAGRMYITEVHQRVEGDACFPDYDKDSWREISRHTADSGDCTFRILERQ